MQQSNTRRRNTQNSRYQNNRHSRMLLSGISTLDNQIGGDPRLQASGKTSSLGGFTLLELLIVVLIIGILAAIALPQYQRAVLKSRFDSLKPIAKAVKEAQEIYYDRNGHYADQSELGDLDVGFPTGAITLSDTQGHDYVQASKTSLPHNRYTMYLTHSQNFAGNIYCEAFTGDTNAEQLCLSEGGIAGPTNGSYTLYLVSGNSSGSFFSAITPSSTCSRGSGYDYCAVYDYEGKQATVDHYVDGDAYGATIKNSDNTTYDNIMCSGLYGSCFCMNSNCSDKSFCDILPDLDLCQ